MSRVANEIRGEISSITNFLTEKGFAVYSRTPETRNHNGIVEVGWSKKGPNIAIALKNIPYKKIYDHLLAEQQYNLVLSDGALIQLLYKFSGNNIIEHRLGFFPSPNQNDSDIRVDEEAEEFEDIDYDIEGDLDTSLISPEEIIDLSERSLLSFDEKPLIRIDYTPEQYQPYIHSEAHLHIGHSKNSRIPTSAPVDPSTFILFILRSFYSEKIDETVVTKLTVVPRFSSTLRLEEEGCVHLNIPVI